MYPLDKPMAGGKRDFEAASHGMGLGEELGGYNKKKNVTLSL
jgi:hypothetical protein